MRSSLTVATPAVAPGREAELRERAPPNGGAVGARLPAASRDAGDMTVLAALEARARARLAELSATSMAPSAGGWNRRASDPGAATTPLPPPILRSASSPVTTGAAGFEAQAPPPLPAAVTTGGLPPLPPPPRGALRVLTPATPTAAADAHVTITLATGAKRGAVVEGEHAAPPEPRPTPASGRPPLPPSHRAAAARARAAAAVALARPATPPTPPSHPPPALLVKWAARVDLPPPHPGARPVRLVVAARVPAALARRLPAPSHTRSSALAASRLPTRLAMKAVRAHARGGGGPGLVPALAAPDDAGAGEGLAALAGGGGARGPGPGGAACAAGVAIPAAGALLLILPTAPVPGRPGLCRAVLLHGLNEGRGRPCGRAAPAAGVVERRARASAAG